MTMKDTNWYNVFEVMDVVNQVVTTRRCRVTADEIRAITGAEPRLMAYMPTPRSVPKPFKEYGFSLTTVGNGVYEITDTDMFVDVPSIGFTKLYPLRRMTNLVTLGGPLRTKNEADLLAVANNSNVLADAFGEPVEQGSSGRQRGSFSFNNNDLRFDVEGVQVEIDGCYETSSAVHVVEMKTEPLTSVSIRQLLYGKRVVEQKVVNKPVYAWLVNFNREQEVYEFYRFIDDNKHYGFDEIQSRRYILKEKEDMKWNSMSA
jgi:hypothetical protein